MFRIDWSLLERITETSLPVRISELVLVDITSDERPLINAVAKGNDRCCGPFLHKTLRMALAGGSEMYIVKELDAVTVFSGLSESEPCEGDRLNSWYYCLRRLVELHYYSDDRHVRIDFSHPPYHRLVAEYGDVGRFVRGLVIDSRSNVGDVGSDTDSQGSTLVDDVASVTDSPVSSNSAEDDSDTEEAIAWMEQMIIVEDVEDTPEDSVVNIESDEELQYPPTPELLPADTSVESEAVSEVVSEGEFQLVSSSNSTHIEGATEVVSTVACDAAEYGAFRVTVHREVGTFTRKVKKVQLTVDVFFDD